jgi:MFS family permease
LLIWAWQQAVAAMVLSLLVFSASGPYVLVSPLAGIILDRYDRRLGMPWADLCAGLMTLVLLMFFPTGELRLWHIYLTQAVSSARKAFLNPAYSAAITRVVPDSQYARVSGLRSLADVTSTALARIKLRGQRFSRILRRHVRIHDDGLFLEAILRHRQLPGCQSGPCQSRPEPEIRVFV